MHSNPPATRAPWLLLPSRKMPAFNIFSTKTMNRTPKKTKRAGLLTVLPGSEAERGRGEGAGGAAGEFGGGRRRRCEVSSKEEEGGRFPPYLCDEKTHLPSVLVDFTLCPLKSPLTRRPLPKPKTYPMQSSIWCKHAIKPSTPSNLDPTLSSNFAIKPFHSTL